MLDIEVKMFVILYVTICILQVFNVVLAAPQQGSKMPSFMTQSTVSGLDNGSFGGSANGRVGKSANRRVGRSDNVPIGGSANVPVSGSAKIPVSGSLGGSANVPVGGPLGGSHNEPVGGAYDESAEVQEDNGQQSSVPLNMINQSRKQFKDTLISTGANRVMDTIDSASLGMKFFDNRIGEFTGVLHTIIGTADRVARKKAQLANSMIETGGNGFGGLINGAQKIGGAGAEAVKGVYDGAVGTTANGIRVGGRLTALPLNLAKSVTGIYAGERRRPINTSSLYQMPRTASRKYLYAY